MKTIGLIGGMSCESTIEYYRIINNTIRKQLGKSNSAQIVMQSLNFQKIQEMQFRGEWQELGQILSDAAINLENSGADCILICTNLMHKVSPIVQKNISIPLIHIADAVAKEIKKSNLSSVGLLGTIFTMEEDFYKQKIEDHGIQVIIPELEDRNEISRIIYEELCRGIFTNNSRKKYLDVIKNMSGNGAQGVILGCTEIPLLIQNACVSTFDTTYIHAMAAAEFALSKEKEIVIC